jgi:predicted extracellular nuclease
MGSARIRRAVAVLCAASSAASLAVAAIGPAAGARSTDVVISEVYGGGGNSGATFTNDFVELRNDGSAPVDVTGWSVQYGSSGGTTWNVTPLSGVMAPGAHYLVQQAAGAGGTTPLPTPDAIGSIAMAATAGKVALVTAPTALTCGADCDAAAGVRDFVGYGGANDSETAPAPGLSNTTSASRVATADTDDNSADFVAGAPNPQNSGSTAPVPTSVEIHDIQGAAHLSPLDGELVSVEGIVTARRTAGGRGVWIQDPSPDADLATSDAVFVFLNAAPTAAIGDLVQVVGTVGEFRPGNDPDNLTITQVNSSNAQVQVQSSGNPLPATTVLGTDRTPPTENVEDEAGNVETGGTFDPADDAIDFYESLEGVLLQVNDAVVVNATRSFGEITVLPDGGTWATGVRTPRGGILLGDTDPNPERITIDDEILRDLAPAPRPVKAMPDMTVGATITAPIVGPLDYSFTNYKIQATTTPTFSGALAREVTAAPTDHQVSVATFNVENLAGTDPQAKYDGLASLIVGNLRAPDIIGIEEVQDNDGVGGGTNSPVVDASTSWNRLIQAIQAAGGPLYEFRQIDPVDDAEGGAPGGNIRVGFLFRTDRGVTFVDRPGGGPTTETTVVDHPSGPQLSASPGRIGTASSAFDDTRKSLVGEFHARGRTLFVVVNHFSSKSGDQPFYGPNQPPTRSSEIARHAQAAVVHDFVASLLAVEPTANVVVLGDINDFEFSETVAILEAGGVLHSLVRDLPADERYSYVFEGNSQVLDQILFSPNLAGHFPHDYDVVHVNAEFPDAVRASDHDPSVTRLDLRGRPTPNT